MSLESQLQTRLLLVAPERFRDLRLFRRNIGEAKLQGGYTVSFGIKGQADLYGVLRGGRLLEIEIKNVGKRIKKESDQDRWRSWCAEWRVPHIVLTAEKNETEMQTVDRWCRELEALISSLT